MKTRYLCQPSVITKSYVGMFLIKLSSYDIRYNYLTLELTILLENGMKSSRSGLKYTIIMLVSIDG
jgi:hypothetical protein